MFLVIILSLASSGCGFYLPGVAPKDYKEGEPVQLLVNALTSHETVKKKSN